MSVRLDDMSAAARPPTPAELLKPSERLVTRRAVVVAFWLVILLGVPFWWKATSLERLALPSHEVAQWTAQAPCFVKPIVAVSLRSGGATLQELTLERVRALLAEKSRSRCLDLRINADAEVATTTYEVFLESEESLSDDSNGIRIKVDPSMNEVSIVRVVDTISTLLGLEVDEPDARVIKFAPRYKLVFTLLNQNASRGGAVLGWDIDNLLDRHIFPLLDALSPLHRFHIETAIRYYAPLTIDLATSEEGTVVEEEVLREFVNSAGWNIGAPVTLDPVLHLILYVPSLDVRPMQIRTSSGAYSESNAFITPQWGGVVIHNPQDPTAPDISQSFRLFELQLRKLIGVPSALPAALSYSQSGSLASSVGRWQIDTLVRTRLAEATKDTVETLAAIIKLASDIPNMRVGKEVLRDVNNALTELNAATQALGHSSAIALAHASTAQVLASSAYFNPSMLALLYFPDEHKYAVYTPLFGPVMVPLVVAGVKEIREWLARRKLRRKML